LKYVCEQEQIQIDEESLHYIARLSDGGMRDALSLLDQSASFATGAIELSDILSITGGVASDQFEKLVKAIKDKDLGTALELVDTFMQEGKSADKCIESLIDYFRDLLMVRMVPNSPAVMERIYDVAHLQSVAGYFTSSDIMRMIEILNHYQSEMKYSVQPQTMLEIAIMQVTGVLEAASNGFALTAVSSAAAPDQDARLQEMSRKLQKLEEQFAALVKSGIDVSTVDTGAKLSTSLKTPMSAPSKRSGLKLDGYLQAAQGEDTRAALMKWSQILGTVKEKKITVHAWLVNGELVSCHGDALLVAFKNEMHRNTTEKPENKQLIEQVVTTILGKPYRLLTIMRKEWDDAQSEVVDVPPEALELQAEDESAGSQKEEWISEAIQLFGEDLVTIKED
jgi:DNA polymerase-3 subunit gamma/tau